jgi:NADH:ubiquinone oxidoreductase subunit D
MVCCVVELDGERIINAAPDIGHLHSGFEKTAENRTYQQFAAYPSRMDYVSGLSNDLAYILTVEKLLAAQVPPRANVIRVILLELQRLAAHLIWIGTQTLDLSGTIHALLQYAFREREMILDIFEMVSGARITINYFTTGGLRWDVPPAFPRKVREFVDLFDKRLSEYEVMLTNNPVYRSRLDGIAVVNSEQAIGLGCTGPMLRGTGVGYDVRKMFPIVQTTTILRCQHSPKGMPMLASKSVWRRCARVSTLSGKASTSWLKSGPDR